MEGDDVGTLLVGCCVGVDVGRLVGTADGRIVSPLFDGADVTGTLVGEPEGILVGIDVDGIDDGKAVGRTEGSTVGIADGTEDDGIDVGIADG